MNNPSEKFQKLFSVKTDAKTDSAFVIVKGNIRFSVLTSRLIRVEKNRHGSFCDKPTQAVYFRNFDKPAFRTTENGKIFAIATKDTVFSYDLVKGQMESITLKGGKVVTDFKEGNLKGTYRTLDMVNGSCALGDGLISKNGVAVLDDSKTVLLESDGTISEREKCSDLYFFAYGSDYRACIQDFYRLSGSVPLVPRYCLGNWWSRYKDYSQQEYVDLMSEFIDREIPISVATIDMDWHWVDVKQRFSTGNKTMCLNPKRADNIFQGDGWTGYSWNTELFPDYKGFLKWLGEKGFKVTVNLHPAQGVRFFEDMYEEMAQRMGVDPKTKQRIPFDFADPKYIEAYFDVLHKPYEKDGVDFWWIDWQQEKTTKIKGLDPLWALNHYHTLAFSDENKRPLILSRYANVGSHRYPLGFSGDTVISWRSLDFQPYFTANAANVGYTWWSHDIGGHMQGARDDELYARWVQLGQYSPIMRLHSTKDEFMGKEPWKYSVSANLAATNALRERHAMIPYLYSMNYRTHTEGIALCEPMYYSYPDEQQAYENKNEFFFGSELLVAPVTTKMSKRTNLAATKVWLPKGTWTDIYTGYIYDGGKTVTMYRGIESLPVLAKEGAILPLSENDRTNDCSNPESMKIRIWNGTNCFTLYEDDGETMNFEKGQSAKTEMRVRKLGDRLSFRIESAEGDLSVLPQKRNYTLVFEGVAASKEIEVKVGARKKSFGVQTKHGKTEISVVGVKPSDTLTVTLSGITERANKEKKTLITELLSKYQLSTAYKQLHLASFIKNIEKPFPLNSEDLKGPVCEVFEMK